MKLEELRRQFRKRTQEELCTELEGFIARKRTKILERCDCGHLAEEHAGPDERESLRGTKPELPIGYCYHCSCVRHQPVRVPCTLVATCDREEGHGGTCNFGAPEKHVVVDGFKRSPPKEIGKLASDDWETLPLPSFPKEAEAASARSAEERRRFGEEVMGRFSRDFRHEPILFPTFEDAAKGGTEEDVKKLLGSYAFWIPATKEHEPSEGDLVQLKGWFGDPDAETLHFTVWDGRRDTSGNPITMDVSAKGLYIVEHVACPHERGDRSGSHATFRRGLNCKMCGNLGRVISSKSAVILAKSKTT